MTPGSILLAALLAGYGLVTLYCIHELWTMPPDDPRWDIYRETETHQTLDHWWE